MARVSKTQAQANLTSLIPDNTTRQVSAADIRVNIRDVIDSVGNFLEAETGENRLDYSALKNTPPAVPDLSTLAGKFLSVNSAGDAIVGADAPGGGGPAQQGDPGADATEFVARGYWTTNTNYTLNNLAIGADGNTYACHTPHTSAPETYPNAGANWTSRWSLFALRGQQGVQGSSGRDGDDAFLQIDGQNRSVLSTGYGLIEWRQLELLNLNVTSANRWVSLSGGGWGRNPVPATDATLVFEVDGTQDDFTSGSRRIGRLITTGNILRGLSPGTAGSTNGSYIQFDVSSTIANTVRYYRLGRDSSNRLLFSSSSASSDALPLRVYEQRVRIIQPPS